MNILHFKLIIPIIAIAFCIYGCSPKPRIYNISQEAREYLCYKTGSYWIYKNDSTNVLDSIYVASYEEHTENYEADKKLKSISQIINIIFNNKEGIKLTIQINPNNTTLIEDNSTINQGFTGSFIDIQNGDIKWEVYSKLELNVNGKRYNNVIHDNIISSYYYLQDSTYKHVNGISNEFWVTKNNWIIKKTLHYNNATQSWSLVRSHIVQ